MIEFFFIKMKIDKIITTIFTVFFIAVGSVLSQEIGEIVIEGNKNVPKKEIRKNISIQPGQEYSPKSVSDDISSIYDMDKFDDVSVLIEEISTDTIKVIYRVEEKPIVSNIEIKGNSEIKSKTVLKKSGIDEGAFFDEFAMREGADKIEEFYKGEGYAEAKVESYTNVNEENNEVAITYYIEEGNKIEIKQLKLIGVVGEKYKRVLKQIETREGKVYQENKLSDDIEKIITYYKNNGYLNVEVASPLITYGPEHKDMYITIFIYENGRYIVKDINFTGNTQVTNEKLMAEIPVEKGQIYSEQKVTEAIAAMHEIYGRKGFIRAVINPEYRFDEENKSIEIDFMVYEGPKVYIRNVYIDGNYITKDYVIERELKVKEGAPFDLEKVRKTQAEIFRLGFFSDVKVDMLPTGSVDETDLVFTVEEQKTGMASIGAGYSSQDKLVGTLRVSQENLFGRGQKLSAMWEFGARKQNYRVDFTEPWLFNTPSPFSISVYNTIYERFLSGGEDYSEQRSGGSLTIGRHFTDNISSYLKYSLEQVKIFNVDEDILDEVEEGLDTTSSITPSAAYDSRDYPFDPSKGIYLRASNQIAGGIFGGGRDFVKFQFQGTYFQPLIWKLVGVLNLDIGSVSEYGDSTSVPIYEKFSVGGAESIRGYEYWDDVFLETGGRYKMVGNLEVKFPIVSERGQTVLQGAFFYDIGSVWNNFGDIKLTSGLEANKLKRGFGFGIRFKIQAFPIRLDWGFGVDKSPKSAQWYFTIGDIF